MKLGDKGANVKDLQNYLIANGFLEEPEYNYGPQTKVAVMKLQEALGYKQTGIWDEDLSLLYSLEDNQVMMFAAKKTTIGKGDKVTITGSDAFYGGLGGDYGKKIPASQKNGKVHTVLDISNSRKEYLLKEIYSWVPSKFIKLHVSVPSTPTKTTTTKNTTKTATTKTSQVKSAVVTKTVTKPKENSTTAPFPVDAIPCYVQNLNTGTITHFGISPETVSDNVIATFEDQIPKSRTSPFKAYANSGPRDVSFTVTIHQDYCPGGILETVRRLQALTVPTQSGGYVEAPTCKVRIGNFINMTAVCLSVGVEWAKPYKDKVYSKADVSFSFNEIESKAKFADKWEAME